MNAAQATAILAQINSIETQLSVLKQQVKEVVAQSGDKSHTFADLKGIWPGQGDFSEEEIDPALYKLTPEWIDGLATRPQGIH